MQSKLALTERQQAVLDFIEQYQMENGSSPTIREMKTHFGVSSDNSILKIIKALQEKSYLVKDDTPRGIKLLSSVKERLSRETKKIPLLGTVPAGGPVITEESVEQWIDLGTDTVDQTKNVFMLRVKGDSMIDAGIFEGDLVIVCSELEPKPFDIVVALVDNASTVKRYEIDSAGRPYLKAENPNYNPIYPEHQLLIQGVVTGLFRTYKV